MTSTPEPPYEAVRNPLPCRYCNRPRNECLPPDNPFLSCCTRCASNDGDAHYQKASGERPWWLTEGEAVYRDDERHQATRDVIRALDAGGRSEWPAAMGIDWMTSAELIAAIPPAYTGHIGRQLLAAMGAGLDEVGEVDPALTDLITTLRANYRDAFGRYPSERQMEDFLEEHPGALDLWKATKRIERMPPTDFVAEGVSSDAEPTT